MVCLSPNPVHLAKRCTPWTYAPFLPPSYHWAMANFPRWIGIDAREVEKQEVEKREVGKREVWEKGGSEKREYLMSGIKPSNASTAVPLVVQ